MVERPNFDKIELHLIRVLHTLISERSVSRAAMRLHSTQPAVSAQLKRLRALTGDPLLVRAGGDMLPTAAALELLEPASRILKDADRLFSQHSRQRGFDALSSSTTFRVAASDYLDPLFLPELVAHIKKAAPLVRLELLPLSGEFDYRRSLAAGQVDLVIGNWLKPPDELHLGPLMSDEIVCLVAEDNPVVRTASTRAWTAERYLACEHVAPMPLHAGAQGAAPGVIDEHLVSLGLARNITVRSAHFSLIPLMVAQSLLVLTTGRLFCSRYVDTLPVRIVRCPAPFPTLQYYQLWHDLTHASPSGRWLREQVQGVARNLAGHGMLQRRRPGASSAPPIETNIHPRTN
jgi:DNA-binding transcriptional LysR family regulator